MPAFTCAVRFFAAAQLLKAMFFFCQICIEGNIASGKTTCLDYFAQTTSIEVLGLRSLFTWLLAVTKALLT